MQTLYLQPEQANEQMIPEDIATVQPKERVRRSHPLDFLSKYVDTQDRNQTIILNTATVADIKQQTYINQIVGSHQQNIVNLKRINDIRRINKFFEAVNECLPYEGVFIGCVETKALRKQRILAKFPPVLNWLYYIGDFIFKRFFPKIPVLKQLYFNITKGKSRVITSVEALGRLYSCGFKVVDLHQTDHLLFFIAKKIKEPDFNLSPSYGPLFKMKRSGKNGQPIFVYKLRTMHPFAEYLQEYIYEQNQLCEGGKFKNDIRITTLGKFFRKVWLDEMPMILNFLKGDLKLVGVRPLSSHYLSLYDQELRDLRQQVKPGLVPPFYADMPKTLEEIIASEKRYILAHQKSPFRTDIAYFTKACTNILIKKARSQ